MEKKFESTPLSVRFTPEQRELLKKYSSFKSTSNSEVIREAVDDCVNKYNNNRYNNDTLYIDVNDVLPKLRPANNQELKIGQEILGKLCLHPEDEGEVIIHGSSGEIQNLILYIIRKSLSAK